MDRLRAEVTQPHGAHAPGWLDSKVIAATSRLPNNWLGLRIAIGLRRIATMRMQDGDGMDVVRWGLRLRLHPLDNGCEKGALFTPQMYEVLERMQLRSEIERAKSSNRPFIFVDAGANVGLYSFFVASCAGPNATIIAIEPEPENLRRMQFNQAANPGIPVRVLPCALGETEGQVALEVNRIDRGGTRTRSQSSDGMQGRHIVDCRSLLHVLEHERVTYVDALKMDVEGDEGAILHAFFGKARESLWPRLVIVEDNSKSWRHEVFYDLAQRGYAIAARSKHNVVMRRCDE
jgi:FkbM family methyltransferase